MIHHEERDGITVIRLAHGKANALDLELCNALRDELGELQRRQTLAVVLTGTGQIFSAGVDLFRLLEAGDDYLDRFLPALSAVLIDVFACPRPIVAAINGHAIAGGCIIGAACDYRVMAAGAGRVGVPELAVGVPFPTAPLEILRFALSPPVLHDLIYTGRTWPAADALARGLVDEVVAPASLIDRSVEMARQLASVPAPSFQLTKQMLRRPVLDRIRLTAPMLDGDVANVWRARESREAVRAYLERTVGRRRDDR
jgi:enoyl-CoA hydratase